MGIHSRSAYSIVLLLLASLNLSLGFPLPFSGNLRLKQPAFLQKRTMPSRKLKATPDATVQLETSKAIKAIQSCARIAAVSAAVDLAVLTTSTRTPFDLASTETMVQSLVILWKVGFAYYTTTAGELYKAINKADAEFSKAAQGIEKILTTMTSVWRSSGILVATTAAVNFVVTCRDKAPNYSNVREAMIAIILGAFTIAFYASTNETRALASAAKHSPVASAIGQKGRVTVRAMLYCITALFLESSILLLLAASSFFVFSWKEGVIGLLDLPTPIATAGLLQALRRVFISAVSELIEEDNKDLSLKPETAIAMTKAQQSFYSNVEKTLTSETIGKVILAVAQLPIIANFLSGMTSAV